MSRGALLFVAIVLLLGGVALGVVSWRLAPAVFALGWVAALFTLLGWPLGSMALLLVHALTGGRWGDAVRVPLLLGVLLLPLALLACVPVGLSLPALYPWLQDAVAKGLSNTWYLNTRFLAGRTAVYVVVWLVLAALTVLGSLGRGPALSRLAPAGLILLAITATFASIDLTSALDPTFSSSVYGMLTGTGMTLFALAIAVLFAVPTMRRMGVEGKGRDDLGKLLLALCILWIYLDFVQFLVVWSSNLAHDAPWYARRLHGFWAWSLGAMWALHALVALLLLGIPRFRRVDGAVLAFAALLAISGVVQAWWLVLPGTRVAPGWADLGCMAGLGAMAAGIVLLAARLPVLARERAHA
jgi:hypothetical protein